MIDVLIVDDEPLFREGLIHTVDWESLGIRIAGEAYNGADALEFLQSHHVDMVLTDINMPVMGGLELIERAVALNARTRFIVLSSHDDFHLVKKAFHLGIVDYLLKMEFSEDDLERLIKKQDEELKRRSGGAEDPSLLRVSLTEAVTGRNKTLLPEGLFSAAECRWWLAGVFYIHTCDHDLAERTLEAAERRYFENGKLLAVKYESQLVVLYGQDSSDMTRAENFLLTLKSEMAETTGTDVSLSAGLSMLHEAQSVFTLFEEAEKAGSLGFLRGKGRLLNYEHYKNSVKTKPEMNPDHILSRFTELVQHRKLKELRENLADFQIDAHSYSASSVSVIKELYSKYYSHLQILIEQLRLTGVRSLSQYLSDFESLEICRADLADYNEWLQTVIVAFSESLEGKSTLTRQLIDFIGRNYQSDISLSEAAVKLQANPSYLSRLFSREMGTGFNAYLTEFRINRALELMSRENLRIYEVAEMVGFVTPESFSRSFKKVTGKSPKNFIL